MTKHPSQKVMNFRHLLGCDTIVTYIYGGKIWGSDINFRVKFWGQAPRPPNIEVPPENIKCGFWDKPAACMNHSCFYLVQYL